jgi:chemotaxis signal transduction protein
MNSTQGAILIAMVQEVAPDDPHERFLLVRTGNLNCALPISDVVRVVRMLRTHPVPGSRSHLVGLAQYGGDPMPVLDLQVLADGGVSNTRHHSTVILGRGRQRGHSILGLAVDEILRVVDLPKSVSVGADSDLVGDTVELDGREVKVLNTRHLLLEERDDKGR